MAIEVLQWPYWPMVARVFSYFPLLRGTPTLGSATLIGSQAILTAAHVIYDPTRGGQATMFDIYFGDGTSHHVGGGNGRVRSEWTNSGTLDPLSWVDAGVIRLDQAAAAVPARPAATSQADLLGVPINVLGFPADDLVPQMYGSLAGTRTSAYDYGPPYNSYRIGYQERTYAGMSGGPVLRVDEINAGSFVVRGVHTSLPDGVHGNGLMLYPSLLDQVNNWAAGA